MFEKCLNRKCDITVAFAGWHGLDSGAQPATYTGVVKTNENDYIEVVLEYVDASLNRKIKDKGYTIFIKKEYIISIMVVE
ncbi:MAG: hypothetical protein IJ458_03765 [Clostridia bacterium]|nr:hypothetical protein [Clostridia bacterium]